MNTITANELKMKGMSAVEACLERNEEAIISVRGHDKYVVMDIEKYSRLREYELEIALLEARADMDAGRYTSSDTIGVKEHTKQVMDDV